MPIDYSTLPLQPPAPLPENATDAQRASWLDQHRICASYAHGAAQQATAEAMNNAADAQRALIEAMNARRTTQELVWDLFKAHPHVTGMTDLNVVDNCRKAVDAYLSRFPA